MTEIKNNLSLQKAIKRRREITPRHAFTHGNGLSAVITLEIINKWSNSKCPCSEVNVRRLKTTSL